MLLTFSVNVANATLNSTINKFCTQKACENKGWSGLVVVTDKEILCVCDEDVKQLCEFISKNKKKDNK